MATSRPVAVVLGLVMVAATACTGDPNRPTTAAEPTESPAAVGRSDAQRTIYLWDPETGDAEALFTASAERVARLDDAERSPDGTHVVFERQIADDLAQIYVLEPDGTQRPLTDLAGGAYDPTWSPDGETVAFAGSEVKGSDLDIYATELAGGGARRVAGTWKDDGHPDWSPDGREIVFDSRTGDLRSGTGAIWVTTVRTGELHRLTPRHTRYAATVPAWSPDGRWIAYRVYVESSTLNEWPWSARLWLMRPDGSGKRRIGGQSDARRVIHAPSWSPDGRFIVTQRSNWDEGLFQVLLFDPKTRQAESILTGILDDAEPSWGEDGILLTLWGDDPVPTEPAPEAFRTPATSSETVAPDATSIDEDTGADLVLVDPSTGESVPVLTVDGDQREPERSPDGSLVVYQGSPGTGASQIFLIDEQGTHHRLTDLPGGAWEPTWSPDGSQIAFAGSVRRGRDSDLFVMEADGSHVRPLARTPRFDRAPDWSPDGSTVVFHTDPGSIGGGTVFDRATAIWAVSVDDGELSRLTDAAGDEEDPSWSPDGRWIAFTEYGCCTINGTRMNGHVWLMRSDGARQRPLDRGRSELWVVELNPTWSPDGLSIAYSKPGCSCIRVVDVRAGGVTNLELVLPSDGALDLLDDRRAPLLDLSWTSAGILACWGCLVDP